MDMLNKECKKLKDKYLKLEGQFDQLSHELQQERARGLQDRNEADKDRMLLELEVKALKDTAVAQQEQTTLEFNNQRRHYEGQIKDLNEIINTLA
jgi:hypothetical protein